MMNAKLKEPEGGLLQAELAAQARGYAKLALEALVDELQNGKGASRISAAGAILDRGFGKCRQNLAADGGLGLDVKLPEEILDILDGLYVNMR